jgi:hypothetical protein
LLGWKVGGAELYEAGGGHCDIRATRTPDRMKEFATICYVARIHAGWSATDSYGDDDRQAWKSLERVTSDRAQLRALSEALRTLAARLEESSAFRWIARAVANALLERGALDEDDLGTLLRESARDARRAGVNFPTVAPALASGG